MEEELTKKITWINNKLKTTITSYNEKAQFNRKKSIFLRVILTLLGVAVSIMGGIGTMGLFIDNKLSDLLILIFGITITSVTNFHSFFKNNNLWHLYQQTQNQLRKIDDEFQFYLIGKDVLQVEIEYLEKMQKNIQSILDNSNLKWSNLKEN